MQGVLPPLRAAARWRGFSRSLGKVGSRNHARRRISLVISKRVAHATAVKTSLANCLR